MLKNKTEQNSDTHNPRAKQEQNSDTWNYFLLGFFSGFCLGGFFFRFAPVTNEVLGDIASAKFTYPCEICFAIIELKERVF